MKKEYSAGTSVHESQPSDSVGQLASKFLILILLLLLLLIIIIIIIIHWHYSPMRAFASIMDLFHQTFPRPHFWFPNGQVCTGWSCQPHAQPPSREDQVPYL